MDPQLVAQLQQTIRVASRTGASVDGTATYGTSAARSVRVEPSDRIVSGAGGASLQTSYRIFTQTAIGLLDRLWLPGVWTSDSDGLARVPVQVDEFVDEKGSVDHYEVLL